MAFKFINYKLQFIIVPCSATNMIDLNSIDFDYKYGVIRVSCIL